jgi:putative ABC transport system permease protein
MGVTIGIFAMISVFTLVDSLELSLKDLVSGIGDDLVFINKWPQGLEEGEEEYAWWKYFQRDEPSLRDMKMLKARLNSAEELAFISEVMRKVSYRNNSISSSTIWLSSASFVNVYPLKIEQGRFFTESEARNGSGLCLIGAKVADDLFGSIDPMGREIKVAGNKATVIGLLEREGESLIGNNFDEMVIVSAPFARSFANLQETQNAIWVKAKNGVEIEALKDEIIGKLRAIHRLRPTEDKDFSLNQISMFTDLIDGIFGMLKLVALVIGMFSILVGGFGIANIMFVSVKERTKMIGIQKALGAKKLFILLQFLIESMLLSLIGGLVALLLISILMYVISAFSDLDAKLTMGNAILGLSISLFIGVLAGVIPAWRASRLDPVVAIRES